MGILLFSIITSRTSSFTDHIYECVEIVEEDNKDIHKQLFFDYDDNHTEMLAADISQLGSLAVNLRVMVKFTARQIYNTSVFWAKYAVRKIAEYIQHQNIIAECLNSNKFRVGMTGSHIVYLYQLCRIVI